jgi:hypothetical protein
VQNEAEIARPPTVDFSGVTAAPNTPASPSAPAH